MPEIFASTNDGNQSSALSGTWNAAHDHVGQSNPIITHTSYNFSVGANYISFRNAYFIRRSFFDFDTSDITVAPTEATLKLYVTSTSYDNSDLIAVKSGHDSTDATTDWFSTWLTGLGGTLSGWSNSDSEVVAYSGQIAAGMGAGYVDIALNSDALSDIASLDTFKIVIMNYTHDYQDSAPTDNVFTGFRFAEYSSTTSDPKIDYTPGAAGFGHTTIGVASANIGRIKGVATANVGKVIGVD